MIKNRLQELREYSLNDGSPLSIKDISRNSKSLLEDDKNNELNKFFTSIATIRNYIQRMEEILEIIQIKQNEILLKPGVNNCANTILNTINQEFKELTKVCMNQLKIWNDEIKKNNTNSLTTTEKIKKNQIISLNIKIEKIFSNYNDYQMSYCNKVTKKMATYYKSLNSTVPDSEIEKFIFSGDVRKLSESIILGIYNKDEILGNIKSRNENIIELETNIRQLNEMYHDLMMLTELQGNKIDCISKEVGETIDQIEKAKVNIETSKKKKINGIKFYIILYGTAILICLFIVVLVKNFLIS